MDCLKKIFKSNSSSRNKPAPVPEPAPSDPVIIPPVVEAYGNYKYAITSVFWVGEAESNDNGQIHNRSSAWETKWQDNFGGYDDPVRRTGYHPSGFTPKANPFYFALPYNDLDTKGARKSSAALIPWFEEYKPFKSVCKNRWIEIRLSNRVCYAQWEDVGPFGEDDFEYVFGGAVMPSNTILLGAGLDVSPAVSTYLGFRDSSYLAWRFVSDATVPLGPWKDIVTTRPVDWS